MSKEIVDAVKALEQEKGISADKLMDALEDALLSAYKKTLGAAKYARVDLDHGTADFRVFELILPPELEEKLLEQAIEQEREIDPETGEMREPEEPELTPELLAPYEDQIKTRDVTPDDFGRIAAQTAKQVILQRIREAERQMMFEEYQDRVGELITGIVQQSDKRYTLVQLRERVEALLPKSEQVEGERYDHGARIKAVITEVSNQAKGPSIIVWRRAARACGWSCPSCGARRSTSSPSTRSPPASWPRPSRPRACARCSLTTRASRPPSSCPTTSSRWRSARRARTPASPPASPAGGSTSARGPSSPRGRRGWASRG